MTGATISDDGRTVTLEIAAMRPTWTMEIRYDLRASDGSTVQGFLHDTIHRLCE